MEFKSDIICCRVTFYHDEAGKRRGMDLIEFAPVIAKRLRL